MAFYIKVTRIKSRAYRLADVYCRSRVLWLPSGSTQPS